MSEDATAGGTVEVDALGDPPVDSAGDVDLSDPSLYLNRELCELAFQRRVLHEATDERNPLLERVKFLGIVTRNMDEFFMKRVGGLKQQMAADVTEPTPDGRTPESQWAAVLEESAALLADQAACFRETVRPALGAAGVHVLDHGELSGAEQSRLREHFERSVLPTLTPLTVEPSRPFPFLSNLSLSLSVLTKREGGAEPRFSRVKIPRNRPRLVRIGDSERFVPLEQVVAANLDRLFPDVEILDVSAFRVTRNAEVRRNQEVAEDLIDTIEEVIRKRRFATVVRLEVSTDMPESVRTLLAERLALDDREVFAVDGLLDLRDLSTLAALDRPDLTVDPWTPQPHPRFATRPDGEQPDLFAEIRRDDVLVQHPYHSFDDTVHRFIETAAQDPDVLAIKAAIYRTASDSKVIESLIRAARNGTQVAVMVELKARFDEANNLRWVRRLEEEGIHVAYGTLGYKTHSKTALVVREEGDDIQLYSHVGTGNYHSETAKAYVDLGLLTADPDVGQDLVKLFNFFTGGSMHRDYRKLLIAPGNMRDRFEALVEREADHARAGRDARIVAKMNRLEDPRMVRALYEAAMAGVDVDLVVRDICRLRPGIEGLSERVTVHSVVGRFLEHSRVWYFGNDGDPDYFVGSADWMTRNLDKRVEAVAPIEDERLRSRLWEILEWNLADNRNRWVMDADGTYTQVTADEGEPTVSVQERSMAAARRRPWDE